MDFTRDSEFLLVICNIAKCEHLLETLAERDKCFYRDFRMHSYPTQDVNKTLVISGCRFSGNSVGVEDESSWGGAVLAAGGAINITSTVFTNNSGKETHKSYAGLNQVLVGLDRGDTP